MENLVTNPKTGEVLFFDGTSWAPAKLAQNPETGERVAWDGSAWKAIKTPPKPEEVASTTGKAVANSWVDPQDELTRAFSSTNERLADTLGAPVDAANWILKQFDIGSERPVLGSDMIAGWMRDAGASGGPDYQPRSTAGQYLASGLSGAADAAVGGTILGTGMQLAGQGIGAIAPSLGAATTAAGKATITPAMDAAAGMGAGLGGEFARQEMPGEKWAEIAASLLGAVGGAGVYSAATQGLARNPTIQAMDNIGVDPTAGTIGNKTGSYLQNNVLAQGAGSADVVSGALEKNVRQIGDATENIASKFGSAYGAADDVGSSIQKGLTDWFDNAKSKAGKVYDTIAQAFKPDEQFPATNTARALANPLGKMDNPDFATLLADPKIKAFGKALADNGGNITYNDVKRLRTYIGEMLEPGKVVNVDQAQLRQLYGSLTDDMADIVATRGPQVASAWQQVTADYADTLGKYQESFEKLIGSRQPVAPEQAYRLVMNAASPTGDFNRFQGVWKALPAPERGNLAATILMRMGVKNPEAVGDTAGWTVAKFLRDYDALSTKAKDLLFRSTGNAELEKSLDDLLTVVKAMERGVDKVVSTSRSGVTIPMGMQLSGAGAAAAMGDFGTAIAAIAGPWAASKLMTSPTVVRTLSTALRNISKGGQAGAKALATIEALSMPDPMPQEEARPAAQPVPGQGGGMGISPDLIRALQGQQ